MSTRRYIVRSGADLARTLAEARREGGLTQAEVAERARLDRTYLARMEAGHIVQQVDRALEVLRTLGVRVVAEQDVDDDG
ncbi:MAG: helix-turn-helix transcriptional regulator [Acidimicrobiia bacterium]|nr:helix-turn-helix transcriptional regulator [Acidimicrobiia bacterium]